MMKALWDRACRLQAAAAEEGFDWPDSDGVFAKLREEVAELAAEAAADDAGADGRRVHELGDILFVLAHLSRRFGIDAEAALRQATERFETRFAAVMADADSLPPRGDPARLDAMEARWQDAKRRE